MQELKSQIKAAPKLRSKWHLQKRSDLACTDSEVKPEVSFAVGRDRSFFYSLYDKVCNKSAKVTGRIDDGLS